MTEDPKSTDKDSAAAAVTATSWTGVAFHSRDSGAPGSVAESNLRTDYGATVRIRMRQRAQVLVNGDELLVLMRGRALKTADSVETRWLLTRVCEGVDPVQIAGPATGDRPAITAEVVRSTVADLEAIGALEQLDVDHQQTPGDIERNARTLEFLSALEGTAGSRFDMHARVAGSSVLLIGTGGLGSWIAYGLAAAGIGRLGLCDPDTVDLSNLNRSILFDRDSVGTLKVEAARDRLSRFSPDLRIELFAEKIEGPDDVARIGEGFDLIIGAADRPHRKIRRWVAGGSLRCGVPSLQAGGGRIGPLYIPGESSCAGCLQASLVLPGSTMDVLAEQPPEFPTRSPGSLAPFPAAESGMVVLDAYRYLSKMAPPATVNGYLSEGPNLFDGKRVELNPHPACAVCGTQ